MPSLQHSNSHGKMRTKTKVETGCHIRTELLNEIDKLKHPKLIKRVHVQLVRVLAVEIFNMLSLFK